MIHPVKLVREHRDNLVWSW